MGVVLGINVENKGIRGDSKRDRVEDVSGNCVNDNVNTTTM